MNEVALALAIWDTTDALDARPPSTWLLPMMLGLLAGRLLPSGGASSQAVIAASNDWFAHLNERRGLLREGHETTSRHLSDAVAARPLLRSALDGVDWLRFACRLLILLAKHIDYLTQGA